MSDVLAYLNKNIALPGFEDQEGGREILADVDRTAGGKLRQDLVVAKRTWELTLPYLTPAQYQAIMSHLDSIGWGPTPFWIDELGGEPATHSVSALVRLTSDKRVQFAGPAGWINNGHTIGLSIREQ